MLDIWIEQHPWMTFILGMMSILTLNTVFVSIGGGYKKFPPCRCQENENNSMDEQE